MNNSEAFSEQGLRSEIQEQVATPNDSDHTEYVTNVQEEKKDKADSQQDLQKENETESKQEVNKEQDCAGGSEEKKENTETEPVKKDALNIELKQPKLTSAEDAEDLLNKYYDFLSKLEKYDNANTLYILKAISKMYWERKSWRNKVAQSLIDSQMLVILKNVLVYANTIGVFQTDAIWFPTYYALSIIWNFSDASEPLVQKLIEMGYIKYYVANLRHEPYITNQSSKNVTYVLKSSLSTLQNCVRHVPRHAAYEEENLVEALKPFTTSEAVMLKALSVMTMSNLISEDENSKLEDTGAIPFMVKCMTNSLASPKGRFHGFSSLELAEALVRMAVNDTNKIKLVDAGVLPSLVIMMTTADEDNQQMAAKLVWTLSFDDNVKEKIIQEPGCVDALKKLEQSNNSRVVNAAKGALWKISGEQEHQKHREDSDTPARSDSEKHIFISYQHEHKQMVHSINARLKADGHKVWIDIEQMGGSTLESMASAVENARVVLVCASERYKLSPSCRTEAEYTFQLKRPIIPLMMQRYYKPDGWLGMLMGAKMYVNFDGKFEFNVAYQMLIKELQPFLKADGGEDVVDGGGIFPAQQPLLGAAPPTAPLPIEREPSAVKWNNDKVLGWMEKNELDKLGYHLKNLLENMNGKLLIRFCKLKKEAPEFFYQQLKQQYELDMMSILVLTEAMDKLV